MDCSKTGTLIQMLRKEKGLTQKELAEKIHVSDRTISKWERGIGCPDVSLLLALSSVLEVNTEKILLGNLEPNAKNGGNMKRVKFYACPTCGNISCSSGNAEITCCGRKLSPLTLQNRKTDHIVTTEEIETDVYITIDHEMTKSHYIAFIACVCYDSLFLVRLYPEQNAEARFPKRYAKEVYFYCNQHGLMKI